jgi:hypothetical protein
MVGVNHLGNDGEILAFQTEMIRQLRTHEQEKHSMRTWSLTAVLENDLISIENRLVKLQKLYKQIRDLNENDVESYQIRLEIAKQSIHIANYCMFNWLKAVENITSPNSKSVVGKI